MIEGLKIDVPSGELIDHLIERAEHHRERRLFYEQQAQALIDGGIRETVMTNDPTGSLLGSAKSHGDRQAFFRFLADHVVGGETYRLSEQDMTRLELVARYL